MTKLFLPPMFLATLPFAFGCAASSTSTPKHLSLEAPMTESCRREVIDLHAFFQDWFQGDLPATDQAFERFSAALAPGFEFVTTSGGVRTRDETLAGVRGAHASDAETRIWTKNERVTPLADGLHLVVYEEWQVRAGEERARISTAIMRENEEAPGGLEWLHVHETWIE